MQHRFFELALEALIVKKFADNCGIFSSHIRCQATLQGTFRLKKNINLLLPLTPHYKGMVFGSSNT